MTLAHPCLMIPRLRAVLCLFGGGDAAALKQRLLPRHQRWTLESLEHEAIRKPSSLSLLLCAARCSAEAEPTLPSCTCEAVKLAEVRGGCNWQSLKIHQATFGCAANWTKIFCKHFYTSQWPWPFGACDSRQERCSKLALEKACKAWWSLKLNLWASHVFRELYPCCRPFLLAVSGARRAGTRGIRGLAMRLRVCVFCVFSCDSSVWNFHCSVTKLQIL